MKRLNMDRHLSSADRHRGKREHLSGSEKRKAAAEKEKSTQEVLAKSRRMTDFFTAPSKAKSDVATTSHSLKDDTLSRCGSPLQEDDLVTADDCNMVPENAPAPSTESTEALDHRLSDNICESLNLEKDIGLWPEIMTPGTIDCCIKMDIPSLQYCNEELFDKHSAPQFYTEAGKTSIYTRKCKKSFFIRRTKNGEAKKRWWLCFSPSKGHLFCFVCKLFSPVRSQFTQEGFCDWRNAAARLIDHETSKYHLKASIDYTGRSQLIGRIDRELTEQMEKSVKYWREVLKRLLRVIVFLSERGLAFRGDNETLGSCNNGNYLGILELLADYDIFLKKHLEEHGNRGSGHTNYLSSTICEELLQILGKSVLKKIIDRVKTAKYFSISLDSTPDEGHVDQLTLVVRFIEGHAPVERFLMFIPNQGHKAKDMYEGLINFLEQHELDLKNIRGQSYDNASAMSGRYNGLQALIQEKNSLAAWVPCVGHSLNLVIQSAASCCLKAISFFDFLEELYVYFTASTNKYNIVIRCLREAKTDQPILVPKRTTTTRWSCRVEATKALLRGYKGFINALEEIIENEEDTAKSRATAIGLHDRMAKLETAIYTVFWDDILGHINKVSESLQNPRLDLNTATALLTSLKSTIENKRDNFNEYEVKAFELVDCRNYEEEKRRKTKRNVRLSTLDCPQASEVQLSPSDKFRTQSYIPVFDQLMNALQKRMDAYSLLNERFGFLKNLKTISDQEILSTSQNLVKTYCDDVDDNLGNEFIHFKLFIVQYEESEQKRREEISHETWMYELLCKNNVKECFPNVEVILRIYLTLMMTNCTAERSFSKLKLIKNKLRSSMSEDRLNILALLSLESDVLKETDFDDIINTFINAKIRRKII